MVTVNMHEAKTRLSELVARAEAGEEIIIARHNKPVVRLAPAANAAKPSRKPGVLKHLAADLPEDLFLQPQDQDELDAWDGAFSFAPDDKAE